MIEEQGFYAAVPTSRLFMEDINHLLLASPDYATADTQFKQNIKNIDKETLRLNCVIQSMTIEYKQKQSQWAKERTELQNQKQQLELLNVQLSGSLRKKETEFQRLQAQLSKVMKESVRGKGGTMMLTPSSSIIPTSITGKSKSKSNEIAEEVTPSFMYLLQQENIRLKNTLSHFNQEKLQLIDSIVNLKDEMRNMSSFASSQMLESTHNRSLVMNTPIAAEIRVKDKLYADELTANDTQEHLLSTMNTVVPKHHKYAESTAITPITVDMNDRSGNGAWLDRAQQHDQSSFSHLSFSQEEFEHTEEDNVIMTRSISSVTPISAETALYTPSHPPSTKEHSTTTISSSSTLTGSQATKQVRFSLNTPNAVQEKSNFPEQSTPFDMKDEIKMMVRDEYEKKLQSMYSSFQSQQLYMLQELDKTKAELKASMERSVQDTTEEQISFEAEDETGLGMNMNAKNEEDLESLWENLNMLPPSSPSTVELLKSYGWTHIPPVVTQIPLDAALHHEQRLYKNALSTTSKILYRDCFDSMEQDSPCLEKKGLAEDFLVPSDACTSTTIISHMQLPIARDDDSVDVDDMNHLYAHFN